MKKILVPTDFSPASHRATMYAAALAKEFSAELYLLHVYMAPATAGEMSPAWAVVDREMQEEFDAHVRREVSVLQSTYRIRVNGNAKIGMELATINAVAQEIKADLIVMGMKGGGRSKRIGSITVATIRKSTVPVLVVPEHAHFIPIRKMTLATDFNGQLGDATFKVLFDIARQFRAHLQVLHIAEDSQDMSQDEIAGKMQLEVMLSRVSHSYHVIETENIEEGITQFIHDRTPDLLVMVAHKHFILDRLFGSVYTRSLSYKTRLPLLVLEDK
jgi:nucleotide-binding universal stress UspA family protein